MNQINYSPGQLVVVELVQTPINFGVKYGFFSLGTENYQWKEYNFNRYWVCKIINDYDFYVKIDIPYSKIEILNSECTAFRRIDSFGNFNDENDNYVNINKQYVKPFTGLLCRICNYACQQLCQTDQLKILQKGP